MKIEDGPPEPLRSLMAMTEEYGTVAIIATLSVIARIIADEDDCCVTCTRKSEWWSEEVDELLSRFTVDFPVALNAQQKINSAGPRLVQ